MACAAGYLGTPTVHQCSATSADKNGSVALSQPTQLPTCLDVDECASQPCLHGGTCVDSRTDFTVGANMFVCKCLSQYAGTRCATLVLHPCVSAPCKHGGTCIESSDAQTWSCKCKPSYSGSACEACVDDPAWADQYLGEGCKSYAKGQINHDGCLQGTPSHRTLVCSTRWL